MKSEFAFIERIRDRAAQGRLPPDLVCGIGDDAAVIAGREGYALLVTTDLLVEKIDFKLEYVVARWLGHKTLAVSLSDIAAMGGRPRFSLLTLGIPRDLGERFWEEFFDGYFALAAEAGVALVGGDISSARADLTLDSVVLGEVERGREVRRGGARAGDAIYVTGELGGAAAGLRLLLDGARVVEGVDDLRQRALRRHLRPEPRLDFGSRVAASASAMIDLSDGLAADLGHLCDESCVSAIIDRDAVPVAREAISLARDGEEAFEMAASGGEDFELLLTAPRSREAELERVSAASGVRLTRIGEVIARDGERARLRQPGGSLTSFELRGYDHFSKFDPGRVLP